MMKPNHFVQSDCIDLTEAMTAAVDRFEMLPADCFVIAACIDSDDFTTEAAELVSIARKLHARLVGHLEAISDQARCRNSRH